VTAPKIVKSKEHYQSLTYDSMRRLAQDKTIADSERVGFPPAYRQGKEELLFEDIVSKLTNLRLSEQVFVEVGCGFSKLTEYYIDRLTGKGTKMVFSDSEEMLALFPPGELLELIPGPFPANWSAMAHLEGEASAVLCYSVAQMVYEHGDIFDFLDHLGRLLAEGGQLLIGDIPNASKRARFFKSERGRRFHRDYVGGDDPPGEGPEVPSEFLNPPPGSIDDSFLLSVVERFRSSGFEAYILPQPEELPFSNRREDILVIKN
jgi:SAM-dependent methyltransferase